MASARDVTSISHDARIVELAAIRHRRAELDARETSLLAAIAADPNPDPAQPSADLAKQWVREDVACALRISPSAAAAKLHAAAELANRFPATVAAMRSGTFGLDYARRLADAAHGLPDAAATKVEAAVLPRATNQTPAQFAYSVRRAVLTADRRTTEQRHVDAVAQRRVVFTPCDDGVTEQYAMLPAAAATAMRDRIQHLADRWKRDDARDGIARTADQRRADALCALVLGTSDLCPNVRPVVHVTVALSTLLHLDDQSGEIAGHGPVPAILARALAADPNGTWRRLLTDDFGQLIDYGRCSYRPPTRLAELVVARDVHCTFPGCMRTARRCELDHLLAWDDGGTTSAVNLHPLCPRHHHLKHETCWDVEREPDGTTQWISPGGRVHREPLPDTPVDRTRQLTRSTTDPPPPF